MAYRLLASGIGHRRCPHKPGTRSIDGRNDFSHSVRSGIAGTAGEVMAIAFSMLARVRHRLMCRFSPRYRQIRARLDEIAQT
jgi:hypothetical protein